MTVPPIGLAGPADSRSAEGRVDVTVGGYRILAGGWSERGPVRTENQDRYVIAPRGARGLLVAVADGMGGHPSGGEAAWRAVDGLLRGAAADPDSRTAIRRGYDSAIAAVAELRGRLRGAVTGTTLVVALLEPPRLVVANVGDSRAYLVRGREALRLTVDHTWVAAEVAEGRLTPEAAARDPRRNVLLRAITGDVVGIDVGERSDLGHGDLVVLCTDGVWSVVDDGTLAAALELEAPGADPAAAARRLCALAISKGSTDNVTAVVCRVLALG